MIDPSGADVLSFAFTECSTKSVAAIATLVSVYGNCPRRIGTQMAIASDGSYVGSISSGCLERAIVNHARSLIEQEKGDLVRYGKGSKYLDITLPCGSGVDILYSIISEPTPLQQALDSLMVRKPCALKFEKSGVSAAASQTNSWRDNQFSRCYLPRLRIIAAGNGIELITLSRLVKAAGYQPLSLSSENYILNKCSGETQLLASSTSLPPLELDKWSAFVFLFHDREWELALAKPVLESNTFYIGAVGSKITHYARLQDLMSIGVTETQLSRLRAPIGLIPSTRDPSSLSVSILADIVSAWPY